jgi:ribosomal protein S30
MQSATLIPSKKRRGFAPRIERRERYEARVNGMGRNSGSRRQEQEQEQRQRSVQSLRSKVQCLRRNSSRRNQTWRLGSEH